MRKARRAITILSDMLMLVTLLIVLSALWVYSASTIKPRHIPEAGAAQAAVEMAGMIRQTLRAPGSCSSMSLSLPLGARIYVLNLTINGSKSLGLLVAPSGADLDIEAIANFMVQQGASMGSVKIAIINGTRVGAVLLVNGTAPVGVSPVNATIRGRLLVIEGPPGLLANNTYTFYYNYKDTRAGACSEWSSALGTLVVRMTG